MRASFRSLVFVLLLAGFGRASHAAGDGDVQSVLPPTDSVLRVLTGLPAYRATLRLQDAEAAAHTQLRLGPQEWVGMVGAARRTQRAPTTDGAAEWELGLDRVVRMPGKAAVAEAVGRHRLALSQAQSRKTWREQARGLLERHGQWLREREAAAVWAEQVRLLASQLDAVARRQRAGDAARIEQQMAEAAWVQAQAQARAAQGRATGAREDLQRDYPGLDLSGEFNVTPPPSLLSGERWIAGQLEANPDLEVARREWGVVEAQAQLDRAEQRPDPTLGLRLGQARGGAERFVGVVLSLPFGGDYRAAGASASAARAAAVALRLEEAERRAATEAAQRLRDAQAVRELWLTQADAAGRLSRVADGLRRAYELGEGGLAEVVAARRLANEQKLMAATGAVDAWIAYHRLALDSGRLWASPATAP